MSENRLALIIATDRYQDPDLSVLTAPLQDAQNLKSVLSNENIGNYRVEILFNEKAERIRRALENFFSGKDPAFTRILYFTCHGIKNENGKLFFAAKDTDSNLLLSSSISAEFVNELMFQSRTKKQLLLLDCCYSGAFGRAMIKANNTVGIKEHFDGQGKIVITATDAMQFAYQSVSKDCVNSPSVFTKILVDGLETGEADIDNDGIITPDELYDYLYKKMFNETKSQTPQKYQYGIIGKFEIARNLHKRADLLPQDLINLLRSSEPKHKEGAIYTLKLISNDCDQFTLIQICRYLIGLSGDNDYRVASEAISCLKSVKDRLVVGTKYVDTLFDSINNVIDKSMYWK